jgi:SRSO17 transposase
LFSMGAIKKNDASALKAVARRFMELCDDYGRHFVVKGKDVSDHARSYLSGLVGTQRRKNIGRIGEDVEASNYQGMQQLISDSPWSDQTVMEQVAREVDGLLGGHRHSALYLDETSFVKKGEASVGVQRQYCGRLGKLENCQVGVFGCLGRAQRGALVGYRLFLPEAWAKDAERCAKAKVPLAHRGHRTKAELALEIVRESRQRGLRFAWVGGDEIYGANKALTDALEDLGETFLMDVCSTLQLYATDPGLHRPKMGRPAKGAPAAPKSAARVRTVAQWTQQYFAAESRGVTVRETTRGVLRARLWVKALWQWDGSSAAARPRLLIVRQEEDGTFKYSLSNCSKEMTWERLGYMQAQRFWIERAFQDAKSELGMAQYEVRGWRGWHHHMTLVCLAMLFILKERILQAEEIPLLTARDIVELLTYYLPRRNRHEDEVLRCLHARHESRQRDIQRRKKTTQRKITK